MPIGPSHWLKKRLLRITADYREGASGLVDLLNSAQVLWYIPVVFFQSKEDTREILMMIGRQDEAYIDVVPLRGGYRPKRLKSKQLYLLQGLPQVGPMLAKRLIEHFRSVSNIINASTEKLMEVEGIGRVSAEKIRRVLDAELS